MSRLVAFAAIQGGYNIVSKVEGKYQKALETYNADTKVGFPNTAYYLPVIYSLLGIKVETLEDMKKPLEFARKLLPPHVKGKHHLPYLGPLLDAGMAALFAFEIEEALRYLNDPDFYLHGEDLIWMPEKSGWAQRMILFSEKEVLSSWMVPLRALLLLSVRLLLRKLPKKSWKNIRDDLCIFSVRQIRMAPLSLSS
jgi:hypothetical protein